MKLKSVALLLVGVLIGFGLQAVFAKGMARVTITGGDLPYDVEVNQEDACLMNALTMGNLDDHTMLVRTPPEVAGDGYVITRYDLRGDGGYQPFDQLRFFFDPVGGRGYVYYEDAIGDVNSTFEGNWYRPTAQSQFVIEYILTQARARLPINGLESP